METLSLKKKVLIVSRGRTWKSDTGLSDQGYENSHLLAMVLFWF